MRRLVPIISLLLAALVLAPGAQADGARRRAAVTLSLSTTQVTAGSPFTVSVGSARVGRSRLYVQRTAGSAKVYQNVARAPKRGSLAVPGVPMGSYAYRVVAIKHRRIVAVSASRQLYSYGPVSAYTLCQGRYTDFNTCDQTASIQTGSRVFNFTGTGDANGPTDTDYAVSATRSSCRSVSLAFASSNSNRSVRTVGAALSTTNSDLQQAQVNAGTVGTATFAITSTSWRLVTFTDTGDTSYWNGTFSCWTPSGEY